MQQMIDFTFSFPGLSPGQKSLCWIMTVHNDVHTSRNLTVASEDAMSSSESSLDALHSPKCQNPDHRSQLL